MTRLLPDTIRARLTLLVAVTSLLVALPSLFAVHQLADRVAAPEPVEATLEAPVSPPAVDSDLVDPVHSAAAMTATLVLLSILLAAFVSKRVTAPLGTLKDATLELSDGRLERRVAVRGTGELRALAGAFNEMAARVEVLVKARYRSESELRRARNDAIEASRMKSRFLATMSHEIRTPMNGVIGMVALLRESALDAEQQEFADTIHGSANHLLSVIDDILDFSKGEAGKLKLVREPFELRPTLEGVVDLIAPAAQRQGLEVVCSIAPDLPEMVVGDVGRLRQIVANLAGNAVKFTEAGEIVVRAEQEQRGEDFVRLRVSVRDTGLGIPPEAQKKLFQPFVQADDTTSRRFGGTGLGIAISKQLVEAMHGRIRCDSSPGVGSIFSFTVELGCSEPPKVSILRRAAPRRSALVIDPNKSARACLVEQLAADGMSVQALEDLHLPRELSRPTLVLVEPDVFGDDVRRGLVKLRANPSLTDVPVVLVAPMTHRSTLEPLLDGTDVRFLKKPVRARALRRCLALEEPDSADLAVIGNTGPLPAAITEAAPTKVTPTANSGLRVLVAEDNLVNQRVATHMLRRLGIDPTVVNNGREAVSEVKSGQYDIVLMDVQMPEMDGYEATAEIRRLEAEIGHVNICAMTANALQGDREFCLASGMDDYVPKPVTMPALEALLARWGAEVRREDTGVTKSAVQA